MTLQNKFALILKAELIVGRKFLRTLTASSGLNSSLHKFRSILNSRYEIICKQVSGDVYKISELCDVIQKFTSILTTENDLICPYVFANVVSLGFRQDEKRWGWTPNPRIHFLTRKRRGPKKMEAEAGARGL